WPPASTRPHTGSCAGMRIVFLTARFRYQARLPDGYLVGKRLAHIVDRQSSDRRARQRLHLDACTVMDFANAVDTRPTIIIHGDRNAAVVEPQRMTKWNQVMRPLRAHHAGHDCSGENRA